MPERISAPQVNTNDAEVTVVRWMVEPWQQVNPGDEVCEVETTKAAIVVECNVAGYIHPEARIGDNIKVGDVLAWVFPTDDKSQLAAVAVTNEEDSGVAISAKARQAMQSHGLMIEDFEGRSTIRASDVEALARQRSGPPSLDRINKLKIDDSSVVIYGTGSQAVAAKDAYSVGDDYSVVAYIDYNPRFTELGGVPVLSAGNLKELSERGLKFVHISPPESSLDSNREHELDGLGLELVCALHPTAVISPSAKIGKNVYVGPLTIIGPHAELQEFTSVSNGASVAHHSVIGRGTRISDGARIAGHVTIGSRSLIGLNATVNLRLTVGRNVVVVSGANVFDSVPDDHAVRADGTVSVARGSGGE